MTLHRSNNWLWKWSLTGSSNSQTVFLLTGSVEHDQSCRMLLQEAVEVLVCQVMDCRVALRPRHLGGPGLGRQRAETGSTEVRDVLRGGKLPAGEFSAWSKKKKSNTAVAHTPPNISHKHRHLERRRPASMTERSAGMPRKRGRSYKQEHILAHMNNI